MSRYWSEFPRYEQPDAGELKRKSADSKKKAQAKGKVLEPVTIKGRIIAATWWGKAWCDNLEQYADYESISEYALTAMDWAASAGLVTGTSNTTLTPDGSAIRAQVATIFQRFMENVAE